MKKLLIPTICISLLALAGCNKKTENTTSTTASSTATSTLSHNVIKDMQSDLERIQTLSNAKAQEALKFQTDILKISQNSDKPELDNFIQTITVYVNRFNSDLEALPLKSSEGDKIRQKMKEVNDLSIELASISLQTSPDIDKITALQKKAVELQQSLLEDIQKIQAKVSKT